MGTLSNPYLPYVKDITLNLLGKPTYHSRRELRWGNKGSFCVTITGPHAGQFRDFETDERGDLVDLVRRVTGSDVSDAHAWLRDFTGETTPAVTTRNPVPAHDPLVWSSNARYIWDQTIPLAGTLAETYLHRRSCYVPDATDLRFIEGGKYPPALVARVTDFKTGEPTTLHFTRLDANTGWKAEGQDAKRFLSGHRQSGGVVRLSRVVEVGGRLGIAEGIETALTVIAEGRGPAWAALGAGNMKQLPPSDRYRELVIWADNDRAGRDAADHLAARWQAAGHVARIALPDDPDSDWNDVVMAEAQEGC